MLEIDMGPIEPFLTRRKNSNTLRTVDDRWMYFTYSNKFGIRGKLKIRRSHWDKLTKKKQNLIMQFMED